MEGNHDRSWMYNRLTNRRELTQVFLAGLENFIQFALVNSNNSSREIGVRVPNFQDLGDCMHRTSSAHMRWHREHRRDENFVTHPSDAEAWRKFDEANPFFAMDPVMFVSGYVRMGSLLSTIRGGLIPVGLSL
ncbi:hypothetical protein K1719_010256 [Acacia pycnantha]|nr:hypothetical protein K1719_010256 [Acacia pycnantha]